MVTLPILSCGPPSENEHRCPNKANEDQLPKPVHHDLDTQDRSLNPCAHGAVNLDRFHPTDPTFGGHSPRLAWRSDEQSGRSVVGPVALGLRRVIPTEGCSATRALLIQAVLRARISVITESALASSEALRAANSSKLSC
jgi:hypothetical protein